MSATLVSWARVHREIRDLLTEHKAAAFIDDMIREHWNAGQAAQHRIVFDNARRTGALGGDHDYLRHFYVNRTESEDVPPVALATVAGQDDYDLPTDVYEWESVAFGAEPGKPARIVAFDLDGWIRSSPQLQPSPDEPLVAFHGRKMRVYLAGGNRCRVEAVVPYRFRYWRDVTRLTRTASHVDLPDPFTRGPVFYAVAMGLGREHTDWNDVMAAFEAQAQVILPGPPEQPQRVR